jgi:hypothetical protein
MNKQESQSRMSFSCMLIPRRRRGLQCLQRREIVNIRFVPSECNCLRILGQRETDTGIHYGNEKMASSLDASHHYHRY